jgi:hypothetical protein
MTNPLLPLNLQSLKAGQALNANAPSVNALNASLNQLAAYANLIGLALGLTFTQATQITLSTSEPLTE